jgi:hypothetical protein
VIALVMMNGCGIVSIDWQSSAEGETILQHFYDPQTTGRKVLGIYVCIYIFCTNVNAEAWKLGCTVCPLIRVRRGLDMSANFV